MTLGQMLDGVDPDLTPSDQTMLEDLLWAFGAWESLDGDEHGHGHEGVRHEPGGQGWLQAGQVAGAVKTEYAITWGRPAGPMARTTLDNAALAWPVRTTRRQKNSTT